MKLGGLFEEVERGHSLNTQNPDRGIETVNSARNAFWTISLNTQNPDRGIETVPARTGRDYVDELEHPESRPRD